MAGDSIKRLKIMQKDNGSLFCIRVGTEALEMDDSEPSLQPFHRTEHIFSCKVNQLH